MVGGSSAQQGDARERAYRTDGSPRGQGQEENQRCELVHLASSKKREKGKKIGSFVLLRREGAGHRNHWNAKCISLVKGESQFHAASAPEARLLVLNGWPEVCLVSLFRLSQREN